jgi:undecaprenyl-diphosphatase
MILTDSILQKITEIDIEKMKSFTMFIQLGAILAVMLIYWRKCLALFGMRTLDPATATPSASGRSINLIHIALAIVPALGLAFIFRGFIKGYLFGALTVMASLVVGGILMIYAEKRKTAITAPTMDDITYRQAFIIGLYQVLSIWPGFSRSGATISGGMLSGASYRAAADFSFLIAIPVMIAASGYEMLSNYDKLSANDFGFFAIGFVVSFIVALVCVVTFLKYLTRIRLSYFAWYRFALAGVFLLLYLNGLIVINN